MIKLICDRCKKELEKTNHVEISSREISIFSQEEDKIHFCDECNNEFQDFLEEKCQEE